MRRSLFVRSATAILIWALAPPPHARAADTDDGDEAASARFGRAGSAVLGLTAASLSRSAGDETRPAFHGYSARGELSLFVEEGWSVGVGASVNRSTTSYPDGELSSSALAFGPRVGRLLPVASIVSIWPQLWVEYAHATASSSSTTITLTAPPGPVWSVGLDVPVLLHASRTFFVAAGPALVAELGSGGQDLSVGLRLSFGLSLDVGG
jgi:hypothetical protein